jgi:LETM1 and EF-hand domain-containing protein 1
LTTSTSKTKEPSSKIEETVERLREKKKAEPDVTKETEKVVKVTATPVAKVETTTTVETPGKKTLWVRFKDEVKHYYSGFKLLFLDVNVSSKILWKIVRGKALTRRESRQLVRTTSVI